MKTPTLLPGIGRFARSVRRNRSRMTTTCSRARIRIRNVLVPIDFSSHSLEALQFATPWLRSFGAKLHLVHVSAPDAPLAGLAAMPIVLSQPESNERLRTDLKQAADRSISKLEPANIHVLRGQPYEQICRLARDLKIDLIVIATRGQTGLKHLLLGSTAERVVRYSPCPVLVVRPRSSTRGNGERAEASLHIKKILVPIDFSQCALQGLKYARRISTELGSKVILMHSICPAYYVSNEEYARYDFPGLVRQCENTAKKKLRQLIRTGRGLDMTFDVPPTFGHAGLQICSRAENLNVDLIVASTHGRTGLKHALLGSTAEYVVRHAPCSVLVVPSHPRPSLHSTGDKK